MEFSVMDMVKRLMKFGWVIVLVTILFAGAGFAYAKSAKTSTNYSATRSVIVAKNNTDVKDPSSRFSADKAMLPTYEKLSKDDSLLSAVQDRLSDHMTKSEINSAVSVTNATDTLVLNFKATGASTNKAKNLANTYAEVFAEYGPKLYPDMGQPTLMSAANGSDVTTVGMKNSKKLTIFGAAFGFVASVFVLMITGIVANYKQLKKQG
ncbi:Wzz/FepE/Etk N-terminal domain-containing protein [Fructobacillus sp. M1-13]|uniref:Capsular polysaccharide biosynthesis protein CpsC n=1 Tax=Fructobacillus papyriferae TaxID=2713171 RepID=A0ABS5QPR6_9LACO|nr:Wzz/FepE/Etk N-terminal domain-containing protein [Fructobacillus papyriferae]MBS9334897.1 capsular biosynthesis protein [Fructobacillus papyriferae]MCD2158887.1 Wzz/FepE/Etk N-terminal domain-containing protein [Fructobacillus papyriferae]